MVDETRALADVREAQVVHVTDVLATIGNHRRLNTMFGGSRRELRVVSVPDLEATQTDLVGSLQLSPQDCREKITQHPA